MKNVAPRDDDFGINNFQRAKLGDARRTKRLVDTANLMRLRPGGTLPHKAGDPAALKGMYRLMEADAVTHSAVLEPHSQFTLERIDATPQTILIVHDTTELDYTKHFSLHEQLGQIGEGHGRGYECHNSLAVVADTREALGLTSQILHLRPKEKPKKQTLKQLRESLDRESRLWVAGAKAASPRPHCVDVCDRGGDVFEFLDYEIVNERRFVVRSAYNRGLENQSLKLHDFARSLKEFGRRTLQLSSSGKRKARKTEVAISAAPVTLSVPIEKRGEYREVPLPMRVVRVWETQEPPKGESPVEWLLLTSEPCDDFESADQVVRWYATRPVVEEFHKAMKTGCGIETLQFTYVSRLEPAIALTSVVALTLLNLRDASRRPDAKERLAREFLSPSYIRVLSAWRYKEVRMDLSLYDFFFALARLGGHQNRRHDHPPGWLILWRGWTSLQDLVKGAELPLSGKRCG